MPFVVSKGGTFGTIDREYIGFGGIPHVVIRWGPLGWLTPVRAPEVMKLQSAYESEARAEAELLLKLMVDMEP